MKSLLPFVLLIGACDGAHRLHGSGSDGADDGGNDAPVVTCGDIVCDDIPAAECIDSDTLRMHTSECDGSSCSYPFEDVECGTQGCCGDHCCSLVASNDMDFGGPQPTGLVVVPPAGMFSTSDECTSTSALGRCEVATRPDLGEACVCRADRITIGNLRVTGTRALVLLAFESVTITGSLDLSGTPESDGPGATNAYSETPPSTLYGGAGGSFGSRGAAASDNGGDSAETFGDATLVPLTGGMRGQQSGGEGGGGGGALQITARERIEVTGVINAGGGGGGYGFSSLSSAGAGGGGSGGAVLLEAHTVVIHGSVVANGGGGGGAGSSRSNGSNGMNAGASGPLEIAYGGDSQDGGGCPLDGYTSGGHGGFGALGGAEAGGGEWWDDVSGCLSYVYVGGGGGGGGVGRIRINTTSGCQCGGTVSPSPTFGTVVSE